MRRGAKCLLEVLVSVGILATLIALLLPAIQSVRRAANTATCANQLRQLMLATHNYAGDHDGGLPLGEVVVSDPLGWRPPEPLFFYVLMPYLEINTNTLRQADGFVNMSYVKNYICPLDPDSLLSRTSSAENAPPRLVSYAPNFQVFSPGANLTRSFPDGTSNTIGIAEHKLRCRDIVYVYDDASIMSREQPAAFANFTFPANRPPAFTFQIAPTTETCEPIQTHTTHTGGMGVAMMDGSRRTLHAGMSPRAYWPLVTPAAGDIPE